MKKRTTIFINEDTMKDIKKFALEHDVPVSKLIEDVMDYFVHDIVQYSGDYPKGGYENWKHLLNIMLINQQKKLK